IRQQQIVQHLATRQGQTEQEITALRAAAAHRVPLPDPHIQVAQLLPKMTSHDDVEAYLQMFEATALREGSDRDDWTRLLAPLLTGEAQRAYFSLSPMLVDQYDELKREIIGRVGLSPICAAQLFQEWEYKARLPARAQATELNRLAQHWLLDGDPTAAQVAERVVVDKFLRALPRSHRQAVGMRNPTTTAELVKAIELADATLPRDFGERAPPFPRRVVQERRAPEGTSRPQSRPAAPGPGWRAASSPTNRNKNQCVVGLVQSNLLAPRTEPKSFIPITCVHGDTRQVPARRVHVSASTGSWPVEVGLVKDLPTGQALIACSPPSHSPPAFNGAAQRGSRGRNPNNVP
ncbi:hypothetical protein M9458_044969, partial [Cirrhinus mrigala]